MSGCPVTETHYHLQELLAEWQLRKRPRSVCGQLRQVVILGLGWLLCLGSTMGCAVAVLTFSEVVIQVRQGTKCPVTEIPSPHQAWVTPLLGPPVVLTLLPLVTGTQAWSKLCVLGEGVATCPLPPIFQPEPSCSACSPQGGMSLWVMQLF